MTNWKLPLHYPGDKWECKDNYMMKSWGLAWLCSSWYQGEDKWWTTHVEYSFLSICLKNTEPKWQYQLNSNWNERSLMQHVIIYLPLFSTNWVGREHDLPSDVQAKELPFGMLTVKWSIRARLQAQVTFLAHFTTHRWLLSSLNLAATQLFDPWWDLRGRW